MKRNFRRGSSPLRGKAQIAEYNSGAVVVKSRWGGREGVSDGEGEEWNRWISVRQSVARTRAHTHTLTQVDRQTDRQTDNARCSSCSTRQDRKHVWRRKLSLTSSAAGSCPRDVCYSSVRDSRTRAEAEAVVGDGHETGGDNEWTRWRESDEDSP